MNPAAAEEMFKALSRFGFYGFVFVCVVSIGFVAAYAYLKGKR